jgi:16S rRNA U516 pseudouridylate synthase RsuA-like enzyme
VRFVVIVFVIFVARKINPSCTSCFGGKSVLLRLQKILSAAGVASRRAAERLIADGRVSVNGAVVTALGSRADPLLDDVRVDGVRVGGAEPLRYVLLNKPRGFLSTRSDPRGRPTVIDLVEGTGERLYPVGRLDWDSEGLLLLTNDGDLAARLMHPGTPSREYHAACAACRPAAIAPPAGA